LTKGADKEFGLNTTLAGGAGLQSVELMKKGLFLQ
jgi:hypothetical protein